MMVRTRYWVFVEGQIPDGKDPTAVNAKLIKTYGIDVSRWERARRKRACLANMQYVRHKRFFLLMASHGKHRFFEDEAGQIRDARRVPIKSAGYSISHRNGHASVRIDRERRTAGSEPASLTSPRCGPPRTWPRNSACCHTSPTHRFGDSCSTCCER